MSIFQDSKYEQLDWVSQAVEPIECELNSILTSLPDEVNIDYDTYVKLAGYSMHLDTHAVVSHIAKLNKISGMSWNNSHKIGNCFELKTEGAILDCEEKTIHGKILLIKKKAIFSDQELLSHMASDGVGVLGSKIDRSNAGVPRMHEVAEIMEKCDGISKVKSVRNKRHMIIERYRQVIENDEWRIRSAALSNKMAIWISSYISKGDLSGLTNLCKLKVMTHKGLAIYSIKEEV